MHTGRSVFQERHRSCFSCYRNLKLYKKNSNTEQLFAHNPRNLFKWGTVHQQRDMGALCPQYLHTRPCKAQSKCWVLVWTPPVCPSGDTNTMMTLKDWLSFTLNNVIWIGCHNFLPIARLRSETASDRSQTGNSLRKTGWSCSCQEDRNCSSSPWTAQLLPRTWSSPANKHNLIHHPEGGCCGTALPHGRKATKNQALSL